MGATLNIIHLSRLALLSSVGALEHPVTLDSRSAQSSATQSGAQNSAAGGGQPAEPAPPCRDRSSARPRARTAVAPRPVAPPPRSNVFVESPRGPIQGYVASRSSTGTKTNTAINETPQSISVIGAEQIRDQAPRKFDDVLRYAPGVSCADVRRPTTATTGS